MPVSRVPPGSGKRLDDKIFHAVAAADAGGLHGMRQRAVEAEADIARVRRAAWPGRSGPHRRRRARSRLASADSISTCSSPAPPVIRRAARFPRRRPVGVLIGFEHATHSASVATIAMRVRTVTTAARGPPAPARCGTESPRLQWLRPHRWPGRPPSPRRPPAPPASSTARTAVSADPPVVLVSSTTRTRLAGDVGPLDKSLHAMGFHRFPHDEGIDWAARCVHDGGGNRVGTQCQSADRGVVPVGGEFADQPADQRAGPVMQGGAAQVDVVVGFLARRQRDAAVHHRQLAHQVGQFGELRSGSGHGPARRHSCAARASVRGTIRLAVVIALYCTPGDDDHLAAGDVGEAFPGPRRRPRAT